MDLGEPFKHQMRIAPGDNGSFVVFIDDHADPRINGRLVGFTAIDDLLIWMARHGVKARVTELRQDDIVGEGTGGARVCGMDTLNGLKRTTAAEIIREREARNGKTLGERLDAMGETGETIRRELLAQAEMRPTSNDAA